MGYVITTAMNGNEALELMKSREYLPDVILLDVQLPDKTGFEVGVDLVANTLPFLLTITIAGLRAFERTLSRRTPDYYDQC